MIGDYLPFLQEYFPLALSYFTVWMTVLAGDKSPKAWIVGSISQILWMTWTVLTQQWNLLPMTVLLTWLYVNNYFYWSWSIKPYKPPKP